jgi:quercetin dioxygenase-like cupin family protein
MDAPVVDPNKFLGFDAPVLAHLGQKPEMVVYATDDPRLWVELEPNVFSRPLFFDMVTGAHCEMLRVLGGGSLGRHKHSSPVHGYVVKGRWRYLEHTWEATEGSYLFEAPGEVHTLVVDEDVEEMITFFYVGGSLTYMDDDDNIISVEDNLSLIEKCREHFEKVGLGGDFVHNFIR